MKFIPSFFIFLLIACGCKVAAKENLPTSSIKPGNILILLGKNLGSAKLEVKGPYVITDPKNGAHITSSSNWKNQQLRPFADGIRWGEGFPGIHQIRVSPKKNGTLFLNGMQYEGSLNIYKVEGKLFVVNDLPVESYLHSLLSQEFASPLEGEVMSAIAIAARTTAYYHVQNSKETFWHVDAKDVGYQGCALVTPKSPIDTAINATQNIILLHTQQDTQTPFPALWTEHSAGKTASIASIYRKEVVCPLGVEAPHAQVARNASKWFYSMPKEKLGHLLQIDGISSIDLFVDPSSNKAYGVRIKDRRGKKHEVDFATFQKNVGKNSVLSNDLSIKLKGSEVVFNGYGKGLGVGLCLYSASAMAQNGEMADKILAKFFPQTELANLSSDK